MSTDSIFIRGFGITNYRSFGSEMEYISPCTKINVVIGQNNSGKSNILQFIHRHLVSVYSSATNQTHYMPVSVDDRHLANPESDMQFSWNLGYPDDILNNFYGRFPSIGQHNQMCDLLNLFVRLPALCWDDQVYFRYEVVNGNYAIAAAVIDEITQSMNQNAINHNFITNNIRSTLTGDVHMQARRNQSTPENIQEILRTLYQPKQLPTTHLIPALRKIDNTPPVSDLFSGVGLVHSLLHLQNPSSDRTASKQKFERITRFLRNILENSSAVIDIPHDASRLQVIIDGRDLDISSLGTGIQEVIIMAYAATQLEGRIVCIEEPELHLHPRLQKKLIDFLSNETSNQYFIATHSAHVMNISGSETFHVRHRENRSTIENSLTTQQRSTACADLGYRASDILQANCVIWVEGPSDRIYLNSWISEAAKQFVEGIHYSIFFYGGRCLTHLSAEHDGVENLISLRCLNRYSCIVIDSDRAKASSPLNATKQRLVNEFDKPNDANESHGFAWVTEGREIENYVPKDLIERAVRDTHPACDTISQYGKYNNIYHYRKADGTLVKTVDKVRIARYITSAPTNWFPLDLQNRISQLLKFIASSNDDPLGE